MEKYAKQLKRSVGEQTILPAVDLGLDAAPAVGHLTHQF